MWKFKKCECKEGTLNENFTFTGRSTSKVKFNTNLVKFANFYAVKHEWSKYLIAVLAGIIMSVATIFLVEVTGLYIGGTTSFFQGLARMFYSLIKVFGNVSEKVLPIIYNLMFWGFYLVVNIPLLIFAYKKLSKRFALLSAAYLVTMQVCGFLWSLIPDIHNVMLFGDTTTIDQNLKNFNIQIITFSPNVFPMFSGSEHAILIWTTITDIKASNDIIRTAITNQNIVEFFLLLIYAVIFSLFSSLSAAILFMIGGSTAGGDIVTIYYSQKKHKELGTIMIIYNTVLMFLGVTCGSYFSGVAYGASSEFASIVKNGITGNPYVGWQYLISANLVASFVWVLCHGSLIDRLFPWQKMVRVEIFCSKESVTKIRSGLKKYNYTHPLTISGCKGGYSGKDVNSIVSVMQFVELPEFIQIIRHFDKKCMISTTRVSDLDGYIAVQNQTD